MTNIELQTLTAVKEAARAFANNQYEVDWEQRRYELAKSALNGWMSNPNWDADSVQDVANICIRYADAIISLLKNK